MMNLPSTPAQPPRHSLAVALIVRDEERCLDGCLHSLQPALRRGLIRELVVVDTGSVDRTIEIARSHGAAVHQVAWEDDFAAARNEAVARTSTDWVLMLDADEWLEDDAVEALAAVTLSPPTYVGEIEVTSAIEVRTESGLGAPHGESLTTSTSWVPRLLPRGVRWSGRVHEQPDWNGPVIRTAIRIGHDGYAPQARSRKRGRNAALLRTEVDANPRDPYLLRHLGRALESDAEGPDQFAQAGEVYLRALETISADAPERHDLVVRLLFTLGQAGRTSEAIELAERELPLWTDSPDFHFCLGDLLLSHGLAHPEAAPHLIGVIEGAWLHCLELGDRPDLVGAVAGRGSHLAAYNLAVLYEAIGDEAKAADFHQRSRDLRPLR